MCFYINALNGVFIIDMFIILTLSILISKALKCLHHQNQKFYLCTLKISVLDLLAGLITTHASIKDYMPCFCSKGLIIVVKGKRHLLQ